MMAAVGRLVAVSFALLLAACAAIFIAVRLGLERATHALHGDDQAFETVFDWMLHALDLSFFTTLVLSLAVVVIGEVARIRSLLYYMAGGGLAVAATPLLMEVQRHGGIAGLPSFLWQVLATAGFAAGAVYWLLAGRRA